MRHYGRYIVTAADRTGLNQAMEQYSSKARASQHDLGVVIEMSFNASGVQMDDRTDQPQFIPGKIIKLADFSPLPSMLAFIVNESDGVYACHLLSAHRVNMQTTSEFVLENMRRIMAAYRV